MLRWQSTQLTPAQAARHVHPDAAFRRPRRRLLRAPSWGEMHWILAVACLLFALAAAYRWGYL